MLHRKKCTQCRLRFATEASANPVPVPTRVSANMQTPGKDPVFEILLLCFPSKHFVFLSPLHHPRHGSNPCRRLQISPCARLRGVITPTAALGKKLPVNLLSPAPAPARGCLCPGCCVPLAARCPQGHQPLHHRPGTGCPVPHVCGQSRWVPRKQVGQALGPPRLCCSVRCHRDPPPLRSYKRKEGACPPPTPPAGLLASAHGYTGWRGISWEAASHCLQAGIVS